MTVLLFHGISLIKNKPIHKIPLKVTFNVTEFVFCLIILECQIMAYNIV